MAGPNKPSNNNNNNDNKKKAPIGFLGIVLWAVVLVLLLNTCVSSIQNASTVQVEYSEFKQWVTAGYVETVDISTNAYYFTVKKGTPPLTDYAEQITESLSEQQRHLFNKWFDGRLNDALESTATFVTAPTSITDDTLIPLMDEQGVTYGSELVTDSQYLMSAVVSYVLPTLIMVLAMVFIYRYMFKKMGSGGMGGIGGVGKANAKVYVEKKTGVTFADVAGQDEAKESLEEIIDFLHNPGKYTEIGAKLPKGALLVGPPGTGKTLLAKAVAGEANVPFFSISGSDFVEMFVGVGASRVRDLFKEASKMAPCIIFIDEIDAIGRSRDSKYGGGNEEREQTLNQLLSEMDGFDSAKGILVLGATNRPEILDKALLRPGRFDRRIIVDRPDLKGRVEILKVHSKDVKMDETVDLNGIALATSGAVGSDLANMINEAAINAVKHHREYVSQKDLLEAVEVVLVGKEKKDRVMNQHEREVVSYHEVGHALINALQKNAEPVQKITIVPRTMGALGYVMQVPEEEHYLNSKEELHDMIVGLLGGRAAEELKFKSVTTGASNDIEKATGLAKAMVTQYGMSERFGLMGLATVESQYLEGRAAMNCADATAAAVDEEVRQIMENCYQEAKKLLSENMDVMDVIAAYLIKEETITGEQFMKLYRKTKGIPEPADAEKTAAQRFEEQLAKEEHRAPEQPQESCSSAENGAQQEGMEQPDPGQSSDRVESVQEPTADTTSNETASKEEEPAEGDSSETAGSGSESRPQGPVGRFSNAPMDRLDP